MTDLFTKLFDQSFASRWAGTCSGWTKDLVIAHLIADFLIWFAYMTIPVFLVLLARRRRDVPFNIFFFWFAAFIIGCGLTHLSTIFMSFYPFYYLDFWVKMLTATASIATAWLLWKTYPDMLAVPNPFVTIEVIQHAKERMDYVLGTCFNAFVMMDKDGMITEWNKAAERIFGWNREEVIGKTVAEILIPKQYRIAHKDGLQRFLTTGIGPLFGKYIELTALTKDQDEIPVEISINTIKLNNEIIFSAFIRDIRERKEAESKLRNFQTMFEISLDMMCVSNGERLLKVNKAFTATLGYTEEELLNTPYRDFIHPDDIPGTNLESHHIHVEGKSVKGFENRWKSKSGEWRWLSWAATLNAPDNVVYAVARDVTERRQMEDKLKQANSELEQFAYVASHDLKAPLRAVNNLILWIEEDIGKSLSGESKRHMQLVHERIKRMNNLIDGILQYSRIGRVYKDEEILDVGKIIAETVDSLDKKDFTIDITPMPAIKGNKIMVAQLFANLICNAIKHHNRSDGHIAVSVQDVGADYQFCVKDDGPGIDASLHHKLFVMFQTLGTTTPESTGMGLALCKKIVECVGGKIWVESAKGMGAAFYFTWPKFSEEPLNTV